jgi:perosamine synthetase
VEDAAESHGAEYKGERTGSLSDIAAFSFYANKIITTGEGGIITTDDKKLAERAALLRNHAFGKPRFVHTQLGFNYRMTNIQAAIGLAQLEKADTLVGKRINNARLYTSHLQDTEGITTPPEKDWAKNVYWMYGILVEDGFGMTKEELMQHLEEKGIETRSFFQPMHMQPVFIDKKSDEKNKAGYAFPDTKGEYPISEELYSKGLYLPSGSSLTEEQIKTVVETIKRVSDRKPKIKK